jgi:hypothetical protein
MKAVGDALKAGVGGLIEPQGKAGVTIADYAGVAHDVFDLFIADMVYVVGIVEAAAVEFTEKGIVQAEKFAKAGNEIFKGIENGVKAAAAVGKLGVGLSLDNAMAAMTSSVVNAITAIAEGFNSLVTAAYHFGYDWVSNIIAGMEDRLGDLEDLLAYIRGLFPSSPAKYGPWRTLPEGDAVGAGFTSDMASGLWGGAGGVVGALGTLRDAFGMSAAGPGGMALATAQVGGSGSITININNPTVRSDQDIDRIAAAVGDVLARQASTNSRMGRL